MRRDAMILLALLFLAAVPVRLYHPVTIADLVAGKVRQTHVEVRGFPAYTKMEADGDRHTALCDSPIIKTMDRKHCVVLECVPWRPCPAPKVGLEVMGRGIQRFDKENGHGWTELHPLEWWSWKEVR